MVSSMKKYDLHKHDFSKLHFDIRDAVPYLAANADKPYKPHRHSFYQIIWFEQAGQHYVDYQLITHEKHTVIFIRPEQVHYFCDQSANAGYLYHFNAAFIAQHGQRQLDRLSLSVFNDILGHQLVLPMESVAVLQSLTDHIRHEMGHTQHGYKEIVYHYFMVLLGHLERLHYTVNDMGNSGAKDLSVASHFKQLIQENIKEAHSIEHFASLLHISSRKLTQVIKSVFQTTPAVLIKESKILEAKRILSNQNIAIKEVAYKVGFDQPTYFTKFFKKETGVTPREFQRSIR